MYPEAPKMLIIIEINHDINKYHYNFSILIFFSFTGANFYLIILCFFFQVINIEHFGAHIKS